jgi:hypothetical protein
MTVRRELAATNCQIQICNFNICPPNLFDGKGLFSYFRSQNKYENPHKANVVNVSASSTINSTYEPLNVLDWNRKSRWMSRDFSGQWIQIDLQNMKFVLNTIAIIPASRNFTRCWALLGSNGEGHPSDLIHQSNNDPRFNSSNIVLIMIANPWPFSKYKIVATNPLTNEDQHPFEVSAIEFFGKPLQNQPNQRLMMQFWNQFLFSEIVLPQRIDFSRNEDVVNGLFHFLRMKANNQNPMAAGLINLTSLSIFGPHVPENVLN